MRRLSSCILVTLWFVIIFSVIFISGGCSNPDHEGFAIYLTEGDIPPEQMPVLSHVDIAEQPVISIDDIIKYDAATHEITLTADAFDRFLGLEVPVSGRSFVVCVDKGLIYWGAFWVPISSLSFDGVTIMKPLITQDPKVIKIELGYPTSSFYVGEDPRNNAEVMKSLEQSGKLIHVSTIEKLPHSMKGYELYSWQEDNQWHFTLITGTNRNKTLAEIISIEDTISEDGWVRIHVVGVDDIIAVLRRLRQNEQIFWPASLREEQTPQNGANITLPSESIINTIKEYAGQCGLDLMVEPS